MCSICDAHTCQAPKNAARLTSALAKINDEKLPRFCHTSFHPLSGFARPPRKKWSPSRRHVGEFERAKTSKQLNGPTRPPPPATNLGDISLDFGSDKSHLVFGVENEVKWLPHVFRLCERSERGNVKFCEREIR
jgi:hypothetical protein